MPRERLPARRKNRGLEVEHIWAPGTESQILEPMLITIGYYDDGRVGEVFISYPPMEGERKKSERTVSLGNDVATLISIAIQYGAPIDVLRGAVSRAEVNWMGRMRTMPQTIVGSVLDAIATAEADVK